MSSRAFVLSADPVRFLTEEKAGNYFSQPALLDKMINAGWIRPAVHKRKTKLYDVEDLDKCADRLKLGEFPGE